MNSADSSPPEDPPEFISQPHNPSDEEEEETGQDRSASLRRKKGGYDSRVEQILCENEDLQIVITDAGKSQESGASYIVYTIKTGVSLQRFVLEDVWLTPIRIWRSDDDIPNSALYGLHS